MMRDNFCVFILSHGRADNVITLKALQKAGYTGKWFIVIDNEDEQAQNYYSTYGVDHVVMFDKLAISETFDTADTFDDRRTIVYARNACFKIAAEKNIRYFVEFDDDYNLFAHRYQVGDRLLSTSTTHIDDVFEAMLRFLESTGAITVAFAQGGDLIGDIDNGNFKKKLLRKAMNSFFCDTEKPFQFLGRVNEDVNTYTLLGQQGILMFTICKFMLNQKQTQSNAGGMTSTYLDNGTFVKSFYSVMYSPSCVKIAAMGDKHMRMHHRVNWDCCTPKILNQRWKKSKGG